MHTPLCKHAFGEPMAYAEQAKMLCFDSIIFTCHSPMPDNWWPEVRMDPEQWDDYVALIAETTERCRGELDVFLGVESDYFPGMEDWIANLHQSAPLHYCLGSVHYQGAKYQERYDTGDTFQFYRTYFDLLAQSAESGLFDCLAHPDLVKSFSPKEWDFEKIEPVIDAALDRIAKTGVSMELNTSGKNKAYPEMNPGPLILRKMRERGITVVLGSDSHTPRRVGDAFVTALRTLRNAGYEEVAYFRERKRHFSRIEPLLERLELVESALQ